MHTLISQINSYGTQQIPFVLLVDFDMQAPRLLTLRQLSEEGIQISFPNFSNTKQEGPSAISIKSSPVTYEAFLVQFKKVMAEIKYGNSFLCNLTCSTHIETDASLKTIFNTVKAPYKILMQDQWVCFSPEKFVQINGKEIATYPMKGTINADLEDAENILLNDKKELAEHYTIVDLLRNDLSLVSKNVRVKKFRYLDKINTTTKNLLQASSAIVGDLEPDWVNHLGTIIFKLLPAGSISGAPKQKTLEIIANAETHQRGFYTGTAFYFDGKSLDSCVLIRFIEQTANGLIYKSGGGITINSDPEKEYQELLDKIYIPS